MLDLYVLTFNCARHLVDPDAFAPSFFDALPKGAAVPDVVAVSLQEVAPIAYAFLGGSYLKPYFDRVSTTAQLAADLHSHGSERLEHVATRSLGMTALMIFAKPQFTERIQWLQSAGAGVGFWNMGNKGAVAMRMGVSSPGSDDTLNLTFTAAHLAPAESNIEARNQDWENIVRNMVFNNDGSAYSSSEETALISSLNPPTDNAGLFSPGNLLFFAGDLNYRTHDTPPGPNDHKTYPQLAASDTSAAHFSHFLETDQLHREREAHRTLHGLNELPIDFPPTYKYSVRKDANTNKRSTSGAHVRYEWAKHRYPSWCDRILFSSLPSSRLELQIYTSLPVQSTSDHRPVALSLRVDDRSLSHAVEDTHTKSPFPRNPDWQARLNASRRWELIVGILSYLALTKKGHAIIVAVAGIAFASWYMTVWLKR